jgi:tetrahydromethanopterin S-methyltransferase subunit G
MKEMSASKKVKKSTSKDIMSPTKKISKKDATRYNHPTSSPLMTPPPTVAPTCLECDDGIALADLMNTITLNRSSSTQMEGKTVPRDISRSSILHALVVLLVVVALVKKVASMLLRWFSTNHPEVDPNIISENKLDERKCFEVVIIPERQTKGKDSWHDDDDNHDQ